MKEIFKNINATKTVSDTFAKRLFFVLIFIFSVYLFLKYAFFAVLPFLVSYAVSLIICPMAEVLKKRARIPEKLSAAVLVTLVLAILFGTCFFCGARLFDEAERLVEEASRGEGVLTELMSKIEKGISSIYSRVSFLGIDGAECEAFISQLSENLIAIVSSSLASSFASVVSGTPNIFIGVAVTLMSCYYFCMDKRRITGSVRSLLPQSIRQRTALLISLAKKALVKYTRAYLILMLITFLSTFLGLLILKAEYAFLISLAVALVDVLPLVGAGAVLLPYALITFLMGDASLALGIIVLFGAVLIIKQIAEPKIVGSSIGLHPVTSLFSMYIGLRLFGMLGMIAGPAVAFVIREMISLDGACNEAV